jgi:hypothetical protein
MTFGWSVADLLASSLNQFLDRAPHLNAIEPPLCVTSSIGLFPECRSLVACVTYDPFEWVNIPQTRYCDKRTLPLFQKVHI